MQIVCKSSAYISSDDAYRATMFIERERFTSRERIIEDESPLFFQTIALESREQESHSALKECIGRVQSTIYQLHTVEYVCKSCQIVGADRGQTISASLAGPLTGQRDQR